MDKKIRQKTLRLLSNGLYVLTSRISNQYSAATISWLSQSSFNPPLLMAAIRKNSNILKFLVESKIAAIHILNDEQGDLAKKFIRTTRFEVGLLNGIAFQEGKTSAPIIPTISAYIECRVKDIIETEGDHAVVILEVVEANCTNDIRPLTIAESPWEYGG